MSLQDKTVQRSLDRSSLKGRCGNVQKSRSSNRLNDLRCAKPERLAAMMTTLRGTVAALALAIVATACNQNDNNDVLTPFNPVAPTVGSSDLIEFRVDGELINPVVVRVNNSIDGLTQATAILPYSHTLLVDRDSAFVSLEARGTGTGFLHAAIFLNGRIFREASSTAPNPIVTISGTYRRGQ